ncbi:MAG: DUF423 domain-containing protein [Cytophagales bacterium]|nr:DUF423 domain-containing protein [Cytophagales bacterium]
MNKLFLKSGAILGLLAVVIGAFGAHAFKESLVANNCLDTYETAVSYQFYHALALLFSGILSGQIQNKWIRFSGLSFLVGTIIFSGSLYLICLTGIKTFGAVAPIGGTAFIAGWALMFWAFLKD